MKFLNLVPILFCLMVAGNSACYAQSSENGTPIGVSMGTQTVHGKKAIRAVVDPNIAKPNSPTFVKIKGVKFKNGTIEVKVLSRLLDPSSSTARGFIGVAFRI